MKNNLNTIAKKITLLNQTILDSMLEKNNKEIVKNFTKSSIKILEADFGWAWWKFKEEKEYKLAYKSPNTPYQPTPPRAKAGNYVAIKTKKPFFDNNLNEENYNFNITKYMKSYIIIPICYGNDMYGTLVLCYKHKHIFTKDELTLAHAIGNTTAQAITIHRLEVAKNVEKLLAEERMKVESIADATHEMRTPLAIIKGNVDLALRHEAKQIKLPRSVLISINNEIKHFSNIISDLALITSTKSGGLKNLLVYNKVNLRSLISGVVVRCRTLAYNKNVSITARDIPSLSIIGDKVYLEKMLTNLVKNSITYGHQNGHTKITAKKSKDFVTISVQDDGIGIAKEDVAHVFERFYRGDKSHSSGNNNTGLGLAIVKWVAENHGGSVSVKNVKNKGSIFSVTLPIKGIYSLKQ